MKVVRIFLFILIIAGIGLLLAQNFWVPSLVNLILRQENQPKATQQAVHQINATSNATTSSVSHTKPPTPTGQGIGVLLGSVTLSPTCPVERIPPDPQCAPKPYATSVKVVRPNSTNVIAEVQTNADGSFTFSLAPGMYTLEAAGATVYPRCSPVNIQIIKDASVTVAVSCDTGIR